MASIFLVFLMIFFLCSCGGKAQATYQEQYDLGEKYLSEGDYEQAVIAFTAAIQIDPKKAPAYTGRGDAYVQLAESDKEAADEKYESAAADYKQSIELDGSDAEVYLKLEEIYITLGDTESAEVILKQGYDATGDERLTEQLQELTDPDGNEPVKWVDSTLEQLVRSAIGIPTKTVYTRDLDFISNMVILGNTYIFLNDDSQKFGFRFVSDSGDSTTWTLNAYYGIKDSSQWQKYTDHGDISNVDSLRYFRNLNSITIIANQVTDVAVLEQMPNLKSAIFFANNISDTGPLQRINGDLKDQEQFIAIGDTLPKT